MGLGTPTEGFACHIYIPRQQPDHDWIVDVCHTLWRHGMKFLTPHLLLGTWDEQLQAIPPFQPYTGKPLGAQIADIVTLGSGKLACFDHDVQFDVYLDTNLDALQSLGTDLGLSSEHQAVFERSAWGKLELSVKYPVIDMDRRLPALPLDQVPTSAYLVPPYQQIHTAMLHWLEILCLKLRVVFAVGYYETNSYLAPESDFLYKFDGAILASLEQNHFPPLRDWLESIYVLYTDETLMKSSQAEEGFSSPTLWRRQLSSGGWLSYFLPETLDEVRAKEFNAACAAILKQRDRTQLPLAHISLQRAQEIPAVSQSTRYTTTRLLEQLAYMEQHPDTFFS